MSTDRFATQVALLTDGTPHRVWSLIVTVFGDLAHNQGDWISSSTLAQITENIGIKAEANRVALHRLRKDNWITSRRNGRNSAHCLTHDGLAQTHAARPRIYAEYPITAPVHTITVSPQSQHAEPAPHTAWITPNTALTTRPEAYPNTLVSKPDPNIPHWAKSAMCPQSLIDMTDRTHRAFTALGQTDLSRLTDLQRATLRVLIVHSWRRIVLKTPQLPDHLFPNTWTGAKTRSLCASLLTQLTPPDITTQPGRS